MAVRYNPKIVSDGLLFAVDAANSRSYPGSGTSVSDISNNGKNSDGVFDFPTWDGSILNFNGTDEEIKFTNISTSTNNFSVECWANWDVVETDTVPFGHGSFFRFFIGSANRLTFWIRETGSGSTATVQEPTAEISAGRWYQFVGTVQGPLNGPGSRKVYRDGVLRGSETLSFNVSGGNGTNNMTMGNGYNGATSYFDGKVAIARVYDKVLTDNEIVQNYNALKGRFGL